MPHRTVMYAFRVVRAGAVVAAGVGLVVLAVYLCIAGTPDP
ncbi:hypothetical protein [Streptomyces sp. PSAA01]|nr:hypothetical protein [Streptomyces sp. PSAA01]